MGDFVSQLRVAFHQLRDWAYPDEIDHNLFRALMKTPHDVGGEPDAPAVFEEKEEEQWELNTFVTCEVLGWRGIWTSEERRRLGNVDVGRMQYLGFPYYGRWVLAVARCLVDKRHITLGELIERAGEVRERAGGGLLEPLPRTSGDARAVTRNRHHIEALGKGDPQFFAGTAGAARFAVGDPVLVRDLPTIFYTRTQEYLRGKPGTVVKVSYESLASEDEAFDREDQQPEWFYIVRFRMTDLWEPYTGCPNDTLQAEISERWLQPAT
ncbi:nitrile hydratase [Mycobacterium nebraskense]|uniref:nitrile hydratase n=1 Tax=Mycobacterium nebraskense TaxID=244292 RepID=A0A1X1Z404_9MYCO|nr:SH3-like domain-containing protein [Mycobacterium nebraskense]KKC04735.1 nitrile hydratase [Mycobacterium nebraskense]MCV7118949.1 nitrile hydratase subunit beta [Mycobacterium nebraskense]ORW18123.1 nitrile hydratase [Mycobacterium nebraskense]